MLTTSVLYICYMRYVHTCILRKLHRSVHELHENMFSLSGHKVRGLRLSPRLTLHASRGMIMPKSYP